jgi:ABC-type Zn uptake system ZnuABC Zn-binding protein ZnuA
LTKPYTFDHNISMSIHISNKLLSNRSLLIICITAVIVGFVFVNLLIFYFPRDNRINLSGLNNVSIQSISKETKNQIATTDLSIYNITKTIAKDGILTTYTGPATKLNQDYEPTSNAFTEILTSKAFITSGQDNWLERKKSEIKFETLNLGQLVELKSKVPPINISFGDEQNSGNIDPQDALDYNYLMDEGNLKIVIENIASFLIKLDPSNKDLYMKNQIELTAQITNIGNQYSDILLCNKTPIVTSATNLGYLAQKYGLEISVVSNFDPTKPEPNQIKYLKDFTKSKNTTSFFVDKKIPLIDYTNLKNSLGMEIYYISDYIYPDIADTLTKNLANLKKSQGCQ